MQRPPPPSRLPHDLELSEGAVASWLGGAARLTPPPALRGQVLAGLERGVRREATARMPGGPGLVAGWRPFAAAAALLVALLPMGVQGSSGPAPFAQRPRELRCSTAWAGMHDARLEVYDDPSVSLFHGVETFDRLAFVDVPALADANGPGDVDDLGR